MGSSAGLMGWGTLGQLMIRTVPLALKWVELQPVGSGKSFGWALLGSSPS